MTATASPPRYRVQNIPDELKQLDHWIVFQTERGRGNKLSKTPYTPGTQNKARSNDASTWRSFDTALADAERRGLYLGFCFTPELGYVFIDFDDVLGAHGAVKRYAQLVIDTLDSYSEVSAGGRGVHVFVRGSLPENFTKDTIGGKVEVYPIGGGRFCLVTGDTRPELGSLDGIIEERTAHLAKLFPPRPVHTPKASLNGSHAAELTADEIDALVEALRSSWVLGQKHNMGLAVGGFLAKKGVSEAQALEIVDRLSVDDDKPRDREKAVRDSYRKAAAGIEVRGYQSLRELVGPGTLEAVDGILQRIWEARQTTVARSAVRVKKGSDETSSTWAAWPDPPDAAIHGWFRKYLELVTPTTEAPPAFHLAASLTIAGAAMQKRVRTDYASEALFANLYTVLIGPSGSSRKDTAIKRAMSLSWPPQWERQIASPPYTVITDVSSAEGLIKQLEKHQNVLMYQTELSNLMRNARRKGTSTILPRLIEAFDTPAKLSNLSKLDSSEAIDPYLSIIAATQPGILAAEMSVEDIHSGFANRWLFVPGDRTTRMAKPAKLDKAASWRLWKDLMAAIHSYQAGTSLEEASDIDKTWDAWYLQERAKSEEEAALSVRHPVLARKIALIYAVSDGAKTIELMHLQAAIAFVDWMWMQTRRLMADWGVGLDNQLENRIVDVLARQGPMKKWQLQAKTKSRKWSAVEFDRVFRAMSNNQSIGLDSERRVGLIDE
jgi:hypothetical protein